MAAYESNPAIVFENDSDRLAQFFDHHNRRQQNWASSKACMFPECQAKSVRRSHTIPRGALRLIAEKGHVVTPGFDLRLGRAWLQSIGIGKASAFPGFCTTHEQVFQRFEQEGSLQVQEDYLLQFFRTACREVAIKHHHFKWLSAQIEQMHQLIDAWGKRELAPLFEGLPAPTIESFRIEGGKVPLAATEAVLAKEKAELDLFRQEFFDPFLNARAMAASFRQASATTSCRSGCPSRWPDGEISSTRREIR